MSIEDDLERSGRDLSALLGEQVATSDQLRRRRRRGRALGAVTMAAGALLAGLSVADLGAGTQPTPVDVVDTIDPSTRTIESGSGPTTIIAADGGRIGDLVTVTPTASSEPVADRVLEELLDDELVARSLAEAGVDGDRDARAVLLADAGLIVETSIRLEALELARAATDVEAEVDGLTSALVAVSPEGEIVALAGPTSVVNRQPAGTYLPIVMATALESGVPSDEKLAAPAELAMADDFTVANFDGKDLGTLTLAEALAAPANTPWAALVADGRVSTDDITTTANRLGLSTPPQWSQQPAPTHRTRRRLRHVRHGWRETRPPRHPPRPRRGRSPLVRRHQPADPGNTGDRPGRGGPSAGGNGASGLLHVRYRGEAQD